MENKEVRKYNGIPVDSDEEIMTIMWLEELQEHGYVEKIERAEEILLSEPVERDYAVEIQMKTKTKIVEKKEIMLKGHVYTPEYKVLWTEKARDTKLIGYLLSPTKEKALLKYTARGPARCTWIEVKPGWDQNNMTRLFKINQKWVWEKHGIYINLIQPHELFEKTWTPEKWLTTKNGKKRAINWPIRTIQEYMNQ